MTTREDLPKGWRRVRFGDVVRQVKDRVDPETAGINRYVAGEHMDTDELRIRRWGTVGDGYLGPAFHMRFRPGHVLYGSRRTYLRKVAVADFEGICANTTFVLEPTTDELLADFLPLVMSTELFHSHSIQQSKGSVNPYINFRDIAWYQFLLPPLAQQKIIVADALVASDSLERYREATEHLENVIAAIVEHATCAEHAKPALLNDLLLARPRNGLTVAPAPDSARAWSLTLGSIGPGGYVPGALKPIQPPADGQRYLAKPGALFISRSNTHDRVGMVCRVPSGEPEPLYFSDLLMHLEPDPSKVPGWLLEQLLRTRAARAFIQRIAAGTSASMKKINATNLVRLPLVVPAERSWTALRSHIDAAAKTHAALGVQLMTTRRLGNQLRDALVEGRHV